MPWSAAIRAIKAVFAEVRNFILKVPISSNLIYVGLTAYFKSHPVSGFRLVEHVFITLATSPTSFFH